MMWLKIQNKNLAWIEIEYGRNSINQISKELVAILKSVLPLCGSWRFSRFSHENVCFKYFFILWLGKEVIIGLMWIFVWYYEKTNSSDSDTQKKANSSLYQVKCTYFYCDFFFFWWIKKATASNVKTVKLLALKINVVWWHSLHENYTRLTPCWENKTEMGVWHLLMENVGFCFFSGDFQTFCFDSNRH
jgi:hypothetical protein